MEQYAIKGMSCAACSARVEKAVSGIDGVTSCSVNLLTNSMQVEGSAKEDAIIFAVQNAGYEAFKINTNTSVLKDSKTPRLLKRLFVSLFFLLLHHE